MNSLIEKVGHMIKGLLPFAIVNRNPKNTLSRLINYFHLQAALDAGHTWIMMKPGVYGWSVVRNDGVLIEGSKDVIIDADAAQDSGVGYAQPSLNLEGNQCIVRGISFRKTQGTGLGTNNGSCVVVRGDNCIIEDCAFLSSDEYGVFPYSTTEPSTMSVVGCDFENIGAWAIHSSRFVLAMGNNIRNSAAGIMNISGTLGGTIYGNIAEPGNTTTSLVQFAGGSPPTGNAVSLGLADGSTYVGTLNSNIISYVYIY